MPNCQLEKLKGWHFPAGFLLLSIEKGFFIICYWVKVKKNILLLDLFSFKYLKDLLYLSYLTTLFIILIG